MWRCVLLAVLALACSRSANVQQRATPTPPAISPAVVDSTVIAPPACKVTVTVAPWSLRGQPPLGDADIVAWANNRLVQVENSDGGHAVAHIFDEATQTWRAERFPRAAHVYPQELAATAATVVYAPVDAPSTGGVLDASGTWRTLAKRLPLRGPTYTTVSGGRWLLYTNANYFPPTSSHRVLFDPVTLQVIEVPPPPFPDPRVNAVVALDNDNLVIWGGFQPEPEMLFGDGAVFRIKDRRWAPIPKGPPARSDAVFDLHAGKLMIFGGIGIEKYPPEETELITSAYVLDLARLTWQPLAFDWTGWASEPPIASIAACWKCSPQLVVPHGSFFARGLVYDANAQTIHRTTRVASPASQAPEVRALDDRHVLMSFLGSSEAFVLDLQQRSWCRTTLPAAAVELSEVMTGLQTDITAHAGRLYLWRSFQHEEIDAYGRIPNLPPRGLVVTFTWP
ncbi:MAG: hypothetical protein ABI867_27200 [Kofleriaceae bacterium]